MQKSPRPTFVNLILKRLEELNIPFEDCRGQSYDNGANMRGTNKGIQAKLLEINPRALFVPCGAHTLNLVVADAVKSSVDATGYFGILHKLYTLFSASTQPWAIHVDITLKIWTETRWQSKVKSVEPLRYKTAAVREALIEVRDQTKDPVIKIEAQSLSEKVGSYCFSICTVVWHDILRQIQHVSKLMQSLSMHVDVAVSLLRKTERSQQLQGNRLYDCTNVSQGYCEGMNVEAVLQEKGLRSTKRHFSYGSFDEPLSDVLKKLEVTFFNVIVDVATSALQERFSTLENVGEKFGVLSTFQSLSNEELTEQCEALSVTLHYKKHSDLDGRELAQELKNLPDLPSKTMTLLELLILIHERKLSELYPHL
ncbi:uncharacterized protein LOC129847549 [Salvelinus fontinalis]|uniref:uncharacterized protein LOC129847549 n=1 Tax=Salvelinus fontinalis TaxID=8038 RepID=UPI00248652C8|nr:uncharacterized protein LOC129847549 [Salvelinus fontinalis]